MPHKKVWKPISDEKLLQKRKETLYNLEQTICNYNVDIKRLQNLITTAEITRQKLKKEIEDLEAETRQPLESAGADVPFSSVSSKDTVSK